ncbi:MAG: alpha/beta hydrolase, partial [Bacteroidota bacterium]
MYYKTSGKGKVVVLIHGFVEDGTMWQGAAKALSKDYKVIVPDLEGFGKSELEVAKSKISMEYYAHEIYLMLKKEKVKECILLGHSMGGYVALHFAEKHPSLLKGIGLINSHCYADSAEKKAGRKKTSEHIAKHGTKVFVRELYGKLFHASFKKKNTRLVNDFISKAEKYSAEALIAANNAMMKRTDKSKVLEKSKVPVLLISGKEDETVPLEYS